MKVAVFVVLACVAAVSARSLDDFVLDDALINRINSENSGWTAGRNERFEGVTIREARAMLGALPSAVHLPRDSFEDFSRPEENDAEFDARSEWPECTVIGDIRDQGRCGSCWAFAAAEMLTDRVCIGGSKKGNAINNDLSPQDMVSCDKGNYGCQGGYLDVSMQYLARSGIVDEKCFPYVSGKAGQVPKCPSDECPGEGEWVKTKGTDPRNVSGEKTMIKDLKKFGPFEVGFTVYSDFMSYKSGVYRHKVRDVLGGHAVEVIGYGTEDGDDYWLINNSWGSKWGDKGTFKILRGTNECGLERQAVAISSDDSSGPPPVWDIFRKL